MKLDKKTKFILSTIIFLGIIGLAFFVSRIATDNLYVQNAISRFGYLGLFIAAIISGFNLLVPIPAVSFLPALLEVGLDHRASILILSLGMTVADTAGYILGRAGRGVFHEATSNRVVKRFEKLKEKHPSLGILFIFLFASLAPVPNEVLLIPLGFLRYRMIYVIPTVFAGSLVFNSLYSLGFIRLFSSF